MADWRAEEAAAIDAKREEMARAKAAQTGKGSGPKTAPSQLQQRRSGKERREALAQRAAVAAEELRRLAAEPLVDAGGDQTNRRQALDAAIEGLRTRQTTDSNN